MNSITMLRTQLNVKMTYHIQIVLFVWMSYLKKEEQIFIHIANLNLKKNTTYNCVKLQS